MYYWGYLLVDYVLTHCKRVSILLSPSLCDNILYSLVLHDLLSVQGPVEDVKYEHASSIQNFFLGLVNVIFNYGGISATIEKADVMNQRHRYDYAYIFAGLYSYLSESTSLNVVACRIMLLTHLPLDIDVYSHPSKWNCDLLQLW